MLSNQCSKCGAGAIFKYFFIMNQNCPNCGHHFEREEGFFLGSMIIAYFAVTLLALPVLLVSVFKYEIEFGAALALAATVMAVTMPSLYRYSKLMWIHLEERIYISFKAKRNEAAKIKG